MKIAIIEEDLLVRARLATLLDNTDWQVDFFKSSSDFGFTRIQKYDVIVSDLALHPVDGRQILQSIRNKTDAELFLMGDGTFSEGDVYSDYINGLINRNNPEDLLDKINYVNVKLRIKSATESSVLINEPG